MSRSYKKNPSYYFVCEDNRAGHRKFGKKMYNRRVRRTSKVDKYDLEGEPVYSNGDYRRMNKGYGIDDGIVVDFYQSERDDFSPKEYYRLFLSK